MTVSLRQTPDTCMESDMTSFSELTIQAKEQADQRRSLEDFMKELLTEKPLPTAPTKPPEALVQITIDTECRGCGLVYSRPNRVLLLRFGRSHRKIKFWHPSFHGLKRESLHLTEGAVACESCFPTRTFNFPDEWESEFKEGTW